MNLGKLGVWAPLDTMTSPEAQAFAQGLETLGYQTLWTPESRGRNVLVAASWILAGTKTLNVASGIANIYARDAMAMANAHRGLNEQSGGRFLLGLGVSHVPLVAGVRGHTYGKPVATMRAYLEAMKAAPYQAPPPPSPPGNPARGGGLSPPSRPGGCPRRRSAAARSGAGAEWRPWRPPRCSS